MNNKKDKKNTRESSNRKWVSTFDTYQRENIKQTLEDLNNTVTRVSIEELTRFFNDNKNLIENTINTFDQFSIEMLVRQSQELQAQYHDLAILLADDTLEQIVNTSSVLNPLTMYQSSLELKDDQFKRFEDKHVYLPLNNSKLDIGDDKELTININEFKPVKSSKNEYSLKTTTTETSNLGIFNSKKIEQTNIRIQNLEEEVTALRISKELNAKKKDEMLQEIFDYIKNGGSSIVKINKVIYNKKSSALSVGDQVINIQTDTLEDYVCRSLFSSKSNMGKTWEVFDIVESIGEDPFSQSGWNEKIYNAVRRLNDKIQIITGIERFILYNNKTISVNPDYIK